MFKSLTVALTVGAVVAAGATATATARTPTAHAAASCSVGNGKGYGYTYLDSLNVSHTSCATGKNVARHHGNLRGWHCSQKTLESSSTELIAQKSCTSGRKKVVYKFTKSK